MANEFRNDKDQLQAALTEERRKRVKLCELLLVVLGIDASTIGPGNGFLDGLVRNIAQDLDVFSAALGAAAAEDPRTPEVVSRIADRLRYGQLAVAQVTELLTELQLSGGIRRPEEP